MPDHSEITDNFEPRWNADGLITGVVSDADSGRVLMVAHLDAEALAATQATGFAHFHSRSRGQLWKKGEASGNTLQVVALLTDCDQDALLIIARPAGPTCHTGSVSCFYRRVEAGRLVTECGDRAV